METLTGREKHLNELLQELVRLAEARQAHASEQTYCVYAEELEGLEFADVRTALRSLAREPKRRFEPSFPTLGTLIELTKNETKRRTSCHKFVSCGKCLNGWVYVAPNGQPCEIHDSPNRSMQHCDCRKQWLAKRGRGGVNLYSFSNRRPYVSHIYASTK